MREHGGNAATDLHEPARTASTCRGEDRWCAIAVHGEEEWQSFCKALDRPAWTRHGKFASFAQRKRNEDELDELVSQWTRQCAAEEVMYKLQGVGVAAGVVNKEDVVDKDVQLKARQFFSMLATTRLGPILHPGWPYKLSRSPRVERGAPSLGEHTHYVCTNLLEMPDEEFVGLMAQGVFT